MISIVINLDTRSGFLEQESRAEIMLKGARSVDFLIEGVLNKNIFFKDYEHETIVYIDYHDPLPKYVMDTLNIMLDKGEITSLTFNRHREYFNDMTGYCPKHNDINYLQAISLARGTHIAHFDADVVGFLNDKSVIDNWLKLLDGTYDFISYPSAYSPKAVNDPAFNYMWASTRFFMCKNGAIKYDETLKCLLDSNHLYGTYGDRERKCPWFEHVISLIRGGNSVWYPPIDYDRCMIFSWNYYKSGTIANLQNRSYNEVKDFVMDRGGIGYPNDVSA